MLSLFFRVIDPKEEIVFFKRKLYRREDVRTKKKQSCSTKSSKNAKQFLSCFPEAPQNYSQLKQKGHLFFFILACSA